MAETLKSMLDSAAARLPRWMAAVTATGGLVTLGSGHGLAAVGFAAGAVVAILAYWWLHQAVRVALDSGEGRAPRGTMVKFAMRYPLLIIILGVFFKTGWLPIGAVIAGLFVPPAGALIVCLIFLTRMLLGKEPFGPAQLAPGDSPPPPAQLHP